MWALLTLIKIATLGVVFSGFYPAIAEANQGLIVRDESLGSGRGQPVGGGESTYLIPAEMGLTRGENLFHSFSEFGIGVDETASFTGPPSGLARILARVTGSNISRLDGTLSSTLSGVDFFLLNPNGVVFSASGALDLKGSFAVSSPNSLEFSDGTFSTTDVATPLSSATCCTGAPTAYLFEAPLTNSAGEPSSILINRAALQLIPGERVSAVGGAIRIDHAARIVALDGAIDLIAVGNSSTRVPIGPGADNGWVAGLGPEASIFLGGGSYIQTTDATLEPFGDGRVILRGGRLELDRGGIFTGGYAGGGIDAVLSHEASLMRGSIIHDLSQGPEADGISLQAQSLSLVQSSEISATAGDIGITTDQGIGVESGSSIATKTQSDFNPDPPVPAGNIRIRAGSLTLLEGGQIASLTGGGATSDPEPAGDIDIGVSGELRIEGFNENSGSFQRSGILARALPGAAAQAAGGDIRITAERVEMASDGLISASSQSDAAAGGIDIRARRSVRLVGGFQSLGRELTAIVARGEAGGAGDVLLRAPRIEVLEGAAISVSSSGSGDAGDVIVHADFLRVSGQSSSEEVSIQSSAIFAETLADAPGSGGSAGNLELNLRHGLEVAEGGQLSVKTRGSGNAGAIQIDVREGSVELSNGAILSSESLSDLEGSGAAGSIIVWASDNLSIGGGSLLQATGLAVDAGDVQLAAGQTLNLVDSTVTTESASALGGNIQLDAGSKVQLVNSQLETDVGGPGNGGNIGLGQGSERIPTPPTWTILNASRLTATAEEGVGGFIRIAGGQLLKSADTEVNASSDSGPDGTIEVTAPEVEVSGTLENVPVAYLDVTALLRQHCAQRTDETTSSLTLQDRPNIRPEPLGYLAGSLPLRPAVAGAPSSPQDALHPLLQDQIAGFDAACGAQWVHSQSP
ncbi:MAG: filamentous hemagglutinin N-terminal domain-containing protein [Myxococcota bacterium]|nr:filamentous hemagglutinin N-terminal domain-containing protein [Myxococcota bacterium]